MKLTESESAVLMAIREGAEHAIDIWERAPGVSSMTAFPIIDRLVELGLISESGRLDWPTFQLTSAGRASLNGDDAQDEILQREQ